MTLQLKILRPDLLEEYKRQLKIDIKSAFLTIKLRSQTVEDFKFYLANSAVHSSNMEGMPNAREQPNHHVGKSQSLEITGRPTTMEKKALGITTIEHLHTF